MAIDLIQAIAALIALPSEEATLDRAVVLDVHLGAGLLDDLADHLAAGADDVADLVLGDRHRLDARRELRRKLGTRAPVERLGSFRRGCAARPSFAWRERDLHDLLGDAGDLDVHLQRW